MSSWIVSSSGERKSQPPGHQPQSFLPFQRHSAMGRGDPKAPKTRQRRKLKQLRALNSPISLFSLLQTDTRSKPGPGSDAEQKTWPREVLLSRKSELPVASQVIWELAQTCWCLLNSNRDAEKNRLLVANWKIPAATCPSFGNQPKFRAFGEDQIIWWELQEGCHELGGPVPTPNPSSSQPGARLSSQRSTAVAGGQIS